MNPLRSVVAAQKQMATKEMGMEENVPFFFSCLSFLKQPT